MAIQDEIPKSRLTLKYKTEISGQPEDLTLPMRLLVAGDFSLGTSKDRKVDLEERRLRNMDGTNTDAVMKDMGMSLKFAVENKID
ncbi:MAG: type VI secretion system contractile sheath small subunit, partial [Syntrophobacterales bacterium]